jgi:hypothetical protein
MEANPMSFTLNEVQQKLLKNLYECNQHAYDEGWCFSYASISDDLQGVERKELTKNMRRLRKLELALYQRGLMNEDGEVAGSGFSITEEGKAWVEGHAEQLGLEIDA